MQLDFQGKAPTVLPGANPTDHNQGFANLIGTALSVVMVVAMLLLMFYLIMGAIQWITSGGDKGRLEEARGKITTAIIGVVILASVLALVMLVQYILNIDILRFG